MTQDGFIVNSAQFALTTKTIGINTFPAHYRTPASFLWATGADAPALNSTRFEADFLRLVWRNKQVTREFLAAPFDYIHLTWRGNLAITIPVQTGRVWGV
jgi:hypothetical protein